MAYGGEGRAATSVAEQQGPASDRGAARTVRTIHRRTGLPGTRAVVGALLVVVAAAGVLMAYADATGAPADPVVIARRPIRVGERIEPDDLRVVRADLPAAATGSFDRVASLVGRVALGPIGAGEMVQAASVTDDRATAPGHEVALTLPREQVAVGRLKQGERVDVFVTRDDRTTSVVQGAEVVQIGTESDGSLTSDREVSIVVVVPSGQAAAALVHALRTGDVTVVRSTFTGFVDDGQLEVGEPGPRDEP
jgi:Flp pilus assembly protein CpaB